MGVGSMAVWAGRLDARGVEGVGVGVQLGSWEYADLKTPPPDESRRAPLDVGHHSGGRRRPGAAGPDRSGRGRVRIRGGPTSRHDAGEPLHARSPRGRGSRHRQTPPDAGHGARTQGNGTGEDGLVPLGRPGNAAGAPAGDAGVSQGKKGRQARRAGGEGTLLRHRRHLHQAGRSHGIHEVRHVRRGGRARRDGGDCAARAPGQRRRRVRCHDQHAVGHRRQAGRRGDGQLGSHHRDHQHRRRRTARARRPARLREALRAGRGDRRGHPHRRLRDRPRQRGDRSVRQ